MTIKKIGFIVITVLILIGSINIINCESGSGSESAKAQYKTSNTKEQNIAPDFTLKDVNGNEISLQDYKGKVILLNFWATWCPPCRRELPDIVRLREELKDKDFEVIGIIVEKKDARVEANVQGISSHFGMKYPLLWYNAQVVREYGPINSIPQTYIIDKQGRIVKSFVGARPYETFKQAVLPYL